MNPEQKNKFHILCIDDDDKIRKLLSDFLKKNSFRVSTARDVVEAQTLSNFFIFDLIVLDIMMPKVSGIKFLQTFRKININIPIIMLTANSNIEKKTESYINGCDDYLIKPFEPMELVLRIKKLLNPRINTKVNRKSYFGNFEFDFNTKELKKNNHRIDLTNSEEQLVEILTKNLNHEISREEIAKKLGLQSNLRSIDVIITRLRKKILSNEKNSFLRTIRGKGYMLISEYD